MSATDVNGYTFQRMGENVHAVDLKRPISRIRDHFTGMLADWGGDLSILLKELERKSTRLQEIEVEAASQSRHIEAVHKKVKAQDTLIETLKVEAEEVITLRKEIHDKTLELEQTKSEINSRQELVDARRRDAEGIKWLKGAIRTKDKEIARLVKEKQHAQQHAVKLTEQYKILTAKLEAVRAELNARKTLVESLRGDAESDSAELEATIARVLETYAEGLEAELGEKLDVTSSDWHASTL